MARRSLLLAALVGLASLSGCGEPDTSELLAQGQTALDSGRPEEAAKKFQRALQDIEPADGDFLFAKLGLLRARASTGAPTESTDEFLALTSDRSISSDHYRRLVEDLANAGAYLQASEVLEAGKQSHPANADWDGLIQAIGRRAEKAGDETATEALRGLGYIGED